MGARLPFAKRGITNGAGVDLCSPAYLKSNSNRDSQLWPSGTVRRTNDQKKIPTSKSCCDRGGAEWVGGFIRDVDGPATGWGWDWDSGWDSGWDSDSDSDCGCVEPHGDRHRRAGCCRTAAPSRSPSSCLCFGDRLPQEPSPPGLCKAPIIQLPFSSLYPPGPTVCERFLGPNGVHGRKTSP